MNVISMKHPFASIVIIATLLTGCATTMPIPVMSHGQSTGFAIELKVIPPIGIFSYKPDQVYFVKIDNQDDLLQQGIIRSNYVNDGRAYLLNARPGTYVAVGAYSVEAYRDFTTYFSKELVAKSKVVIRENDFVFMGNYVVKTSTEFDGVDEVQAHYKNVIAPGQSTGFFAMGLGGPVHYRGASYELKNDEQTRNEFIRNAKEDLVGSGWAARIK